MFDAIEEIWCEFLAGLTNGSSQSYKERVRERERLQKETAERNEINQIKASSYEYDNYEDYDTEDPVDNGILLDIMHNF